MARPKTAYHHGDLRQALVDAAETAVEAHGVEAFTVTAASQPLGVTHAAAYRHFRGRDDLLRALSDRYMARFADRLAEAAVTGTSAQAQYLATGRAVVAFALDHRHGYGLIFGPHRRDDGTTLRSAAPTSAFGRLTTAIAAWQRAGWLAPGDPVEIGIVMWSAAHGLASLLASGRLDFDRVEAAALSDRILLSIQRGIGDRAA